MFIVCRLGWVSITSCDGGKLERFSCHTYVNQPTAHSDQTGEWWGRSAGPLEMRLPNWEAYTCTCFRKNCSQKCPERETQVYQKFRMAADPRCFTVRAVTSAEGRKTWTALSVVSPPHILHPLSSSPFQSRSAGDLASEREMRLEK